MARHFDGQTQYLTRGESPATTVPLTLAAWVFAERLDVYGDVLGLCRAAGESNGWFLQVRGPDGARAAAVACAGGTFAVAPSTGSCTASRWHHVAGVFSSHAARRVYLDGTPGTTETTNLVPSGVDTITVGAWQRLGSPTVFFPGGVAEAAVWTAALDAGEIAALAAGTSPLAIRRDALAAYWPFGGTYPQNDSDVASGRYVLTPIGSPTWIPHPAGLVPHEGADEPSLPATVEHGTIGAAFIAGARAGGAFLPGARDGGAFTPTAQAGAART
ncbi:hypothetical protein JCM19992_02710 [Thermostilla marina]